MKPAILMLATVLASSSSASVVSPKASTVLPVFDTADLVPHWYAKDAARFPDFALTDQAGRTVTRGTLTGRIVVANFFFTGCSSLCPRLRSAMARVRDAYPDDPRLLLLSHSVTPVHDSPAALAAYARANHIDGERWRLLTGERAMMSQVVHQGYLVPTSASDTPGILHTELFVLLDGQQRVRGFYNGTLALDIERLITDIALLSRSQSITTAKGDTP